LKKNVTSLVAMALALTLSLMGCAQQPKSANSNDAVQQSKQLKSTEEQVKFLISEANAFINSEKIDEAVKTSQYILSKLDSNSSEAKSILEKAKAGREAGSMEKRARAIAEEKAKEFELNINKSKRDLDKMMKEGIL